MGQQQQPPAIVRRRKEKARSVRIETNDSERRDAQRRSPVRVVETDRGAVAILVSR